MSSKPHSMSDDQLLVERWMTPDHEWQGSTEACQALAAYARRLEEQYQSALDALREACLHQGLPEDATPERIARHFRGNREFKEGFDKLAEESNPASRAEA